MFTGDQDGFGLDNGKIQEDGSIVFAGKNDDGKDIELNYKKQN